MYTRRFLSAFFAVACLSIAACGPNKPTAPVTGSSDGPSVEAVDIGSPLITATEYRPVATVRPGDEAITVPLANVVILRKLDLPSKMDGTVSWIGVEINEAEAAKLKPADVFTHPRDKKIFRRLIPGDFVKRDQVVALLDDEQAFLEFSAAQTKWDVAKVSAIEYEKTVDSLKKIVEQTRRGVERNIVPLQELYNSEATLARYNADSADRKGAVDVAASEMKKGRNIWDRHTVRSVFDGQVQQIIKHEGDGVKAAEPIMVIHDFSRLRGLGNLPKEYVNVVAPGDDVTIEMPRDLPPGTVFEQHTTNKPIVAVAVAMSGGKPIVVSAADDGWVYAWDRELKDLGSVRLSGGVRCLAVTRPGVEPAMTLVGGADGIARLYSLANGLNGVREFEGKHEGGVLAASFSPEGRFCVTADSRGIYMYDVISGKRKYAFPSREHHSPVTSLTFTPQGKVISAGREPSIRVWTVGDKGAKVDGDEFRINTRSGDVAMPGVTDDGSRLLLDADKTHLDIIHLQRMRKERPLAMAGEAVRFHTFAIWSPELDKKADNRLIATTGAADGVVQLWRAPTAQARGSEVARLVTRDASPATCAAFSPIADSPFIVVGTRKGEVFLWPLPSSEAQAEFNTTVTFVENSIESSGRSVNVLVDFDNPKGEGNKYLLRPGSTVTLVIRPKK
ncbi:MAG: hypothetical protein EXS09_14455 [Gemmataceae bacterium]|nr:hypothetical protein [Gemmataceae bacterium]